VTAQFAEGRQFVLLELEDPRTGEIVPLGLERARKLLVTL
jgi:hypothetical protein